MLHNHSNQFLDYCRLAEFSERSIQALSTRRNEFEAFLKIHKIRSVKKITYRYLIDFVAYYKNPSIHVRKSRVWTLRQFIHFLTLYQNQPRGQIGQVLILHIAPKTVKNEDPVVFFPFTQKCLKQKWVKVCFDQCRALTTISRF